MASMTPEVREAFLGETRVAVLTMLAESGDPVGTPIWFDWRDGRAWMFSSMNTPKVRHLKRDPRASLVVARPAGEKEEWVSIDGIVTVHPDGGFDLAERLADRYWDMAKEGPQAKVEAWRKAAARMRLLELVPRRVRSTA